MADYIEREKLKQGIAEDALASLSYWDSGLMDLLMLEIDECPAADVAPVVHGEWIFFRRSVTGAYSLYYCSACNAGGMVKSDYCPSCGAKMDGGTT